MAISTAITGVAGLAQLVKSFQKDAYGVASNTPVVWSTSNAAVVLAQKVYNSNDCVLSFVSAGSATVTATMGTTTATFSVTVIASAAPGDGYYLDIGADQAYSPPNKTLQTKTS